MDSVKMRPKGRPQTLRQHTSIIESMNALESLHSEHGAQGLVASDQAAAAGCRVWHYLLENHDSETLQANPGEISVSLPCELAEDSSVATTAPWHLESVPLPRGLMEAATNLDNCLKLMAQDASGQEAVFLSALHGVARKLTLSDTAVSTPSRPSAAGYSVTASVAPYAALVEGLQDQLRTAVRMLGHVTHAWRLEAAAAAAAHSTAEVALHTASQLQHTLDAIGIDTIVARAAMAEEEADASGRRVARRNTELKQHLRSSRRRLAALHKEVDELRNMKGQAGRITARFSSLEHLRRQEVGVAPVLPGGSSSAGGGALSGHPDVPLLSLDVHTSMRSHGATTAASAHTAGPSRASSRRSVSSAGGTSDVPSSSMGGLHALPAGPGAPTAQYTHHIHNDACTDAEALSDARWRPAAAAAAAERQPPPSPSGVGGSVHTASSGSVLQATLSRKTGNADNALSRMQSRLFGEMPGGASSASHGGGGEVLAVAGSKQLTGLWLNVASSGTPSTHTAAGATTEQFLLEDSHRVGSLAREGGEAGEGGVLLRALQQSFNDALTDYDGAGSSTYKPLLSKTRRSRGMFVGELVELLAEWRALVLHEFPKVANAPHHASPDATGGAVHARDTGAGATASWGAKGILTLEGDSIALTEQLQRVTDSGDGIDSQQQQQQLHAALTRGAPTSSISDERGYLHPDFRLLAWRSDGPSSARVAFGQGRQEQQHRGGGAHPASAGATAWHLFDVQGFKAPAQPRDVTLAAAVLLIHEAMCSKLAQEQHEADARVRVVEAQAKARAGGLQGTPVSEAQAESDDAAAAQSPIAAVDQDSSDFTVSDGGEGGGAAFASGEVRAAFRVTLLPFSVFWYEWLALQYVLEDAVCSVAYSVLSVLSSAPSTPHIALLLAALGGGMEECVWRYFMMQVTRLRQLGVQPSATKNLSVIPTALYPAPITPGLRGWVRDFAATCADPKEPSWSDLHNYLAYTLSSCPAEEPRVQRCASSLAAVDRSGVGMVPFPLAADILQRLAGRWHRSAQSSARELLPALFLASKQRRRRAGELGSGWLDTLLGSKAAAHSKAAPDSSERTLGRADVVTDGAVVDNDADGASHTPAVAGGHAAAQVPGAPEAAKGKQPKAAPGTSSKSTKARFPELHIEELAFQCAFCELLAACHDSAIRQVSGKTMGGAQLSPITPGGSSKLEQPAV